jgi:hypothetical protein
VKRLRNLGQRKKAQYPEWKVADRIKISTDFDILGRGSVTKTIEPVPQ